MSDAVRGGMLGTWAVSCCRRGGIVVHPPVWADLGSVFVLRKLISPLHTIWLYFTNTADNARDVRALSPSVKLFHRVLLQLTMSCLPLPRS